ncbi:MAG: response regulator [Balneolaceae bacterium]|nr:response regulator [Balneolaceae bacterium]
MGYSILVIDDEESVHVLTDNMLQAEYSLVHARDAQEAIDILSLQSVNLILTDIHMPGMSGLDFLESLTRDAEKKAIPVLVMTHLPTIEKEKKALDLGAADFIEKELFT